MLSFNLRLQKEDLLSWINNSLISVQSHHNILGDPWDYTSVYMVPILMEKTGMILLILFLPIRYIPKIKVDGYLYIYIEKRMTR